MYIDPGTGSMLFTILVGVLSAGTYTLRDKAVKLRFYLSGGKTQVSDADVPDFAIFSDHKRYWNVFEPICDEFEKRGREIVYMTSSDDDPALSKPYEHVKCEFIGEGNKAFARLNSLKADVVLSTTPSLDVFNWKRSRGVKYYVHIAHASHDLTIYRMFGIDYYDSILTSADYQGDQVRALEHARNLPEKEIAKVGLPYMDAMRARLEKEGRVNNEKPVVLLAPSWGPNAIFSRFGGEVIEALLKTDYHIVIRPHPQSYTSEKDMLEGIMKKYPESDRIEWNRDNDNFEVLRRADILVSDFSGVILDFCLVFDKPVIYTDTEEQFDKAPYDACWLDEELWNFKTLPKVGSRLTQENLPQIGALIDECLSDPRFARGREEARNETWAYMGEGAERVVDYLLAKHDEIMKAEAEAKAQAELEGQDKKTKKAKKK